MKKKIIACVLACAMLLMGTGYAYWTKSINLTANASTGKLNVRFAGATTGNKFSDFPTPCGVVKDNNLAYRTSTGSADFTDDAVTLTLTDMYPGYGQSFDVSVVNNGTLAAKLGKITSVVETEDPVMEDMLGIAVCAMIDNSRWYAGGCGYQSGHYGWISNHFNPSVPSDFDDNEVELNLSDNDSYFTINGKKYIRLSAFNEILTESDGSITDNILFLNTDNSSSKMKLKITVAMDPDATGEYTSGSSTVMSGEDDSLSQEKDTSIKLTCIWDQYNAK